MNDISELALLVSKAKATVFTLEYISQFEPADIDSDDVDLRFEVDGRDTGTNVSIVDECGQAAKVICTLVEALEYYKSREERVTSLVRDNSKSWDELYRQVEAKGKRNVELVEALEKAQQRITQLESRTVKLPELCVGVVQGGHAVMVPYPAGHWFNKTAILEMLAAAGIKVEAE